MGAYNPKYTLKEETEIVCQEMVADILRLIEAGDIGLSDFEADPYAYMDSSITYGDKWYERIIVSRVRRAINHNINDFKKCLRELEKEYFENIAQLEVDEKIPF